MLWTNHRVMEWLRTIDLSEYAPNLRGSGVHGALMVRCCCMLLANVELVFSGKTPVVCLIILHLFFTAT
jgi:hypothetical protein